MNPLTVYCGVDVAKDQLDVSLCQQYSSFANTLQGFRKLLAWIKTLCPSEHVQIICEASGGYEQNLVQFLWDKSRAVSVVQPSRVRNLAKSMGILAKTDRIDAKLLVRFGEVNRPAPQLPRDHTQTQLAQLVTMRQQLNDQMQVFQNQAQTIPNGPALNIINSLIRTLQTKITALDRVIDTIVAGHQALQTLLQAYSKVQGIGRITALALIAYFPEAGTLSKRQAAALAGVAPRNKDSGQSSKPRTIGGGRARLRKALYMAALTASRYNPVLATHYQKLRKNGKPAKVALTALMRKLIILANSLAKNPNFILA
jgi:transposase